MGVTFHEFKFLEYITKSQTLGNVLTLGRQELILNENDLKKLNVIKNKNFVEKYSDKILIENFNATSITSLDNSNLEGASIVFDMNLPLKNLNRQFDTIIDFGTSEHIFNVPQSLQNVSDLCKKEGLILHCLPANNNCGHGFWQFSPELFFSLYSKKNGFLDTEIFLFDSYNKYEWWKINPQKPGERLELSSEVSLYVAVKTKKNCERTKQLVQQSDYTFRWDNDELIKKKILKKKTISFIWKRSKDFLKKIWFKLILPQRISEKIEGKKITKKNFLKKVSTLKK